MDRFLAGLPFIFIYLDDVLVASPDHTFIDNIFVRCFAIYKRTASPSTHRSPSSAKRR